LKHLNAGSVTLTCRHCTLFRLVLEVVTIALTYDTYIKKKKKKVNLIVTKPIQIIQNC